MITYLQQRVLKGSRGVYLLHIPCPYHHHHHHPDINVNTLHFGAKHRKQNEDKEITTDPSEGMLMVVSPHPR